MNAFMITDKFVIPPEIGSLSVSPRTFSFELLTCVLLNTQNSMNWLYLHAKKHGFPRTEGRRQEETMQISASVEGSKDSIHETLKQQPGSSSSGSAIDLTNED
jgi:hypothetical protein